VFWKDKSVAFAVEKQGLGEVFWYQFYWFQIVDVEICLIHYCSSYELVSDVGDEMRKTSLGFHQILCYNFQG